MPSESFDFQRYIAQHRDPGERATALPVGEYAFRGDIRLLRTLHTILPVRLLLGATLRLWKGWGRRRILQDATKANERDASRLHRLATQAANSLHLSPQVIYLTPALQDEAARALGVDDEIFIAVQPEAIKSLSDAALLFILGRELGHIQNGHVSFHTAAFYANELASMVIRWAITPATVSLNGWRRRSELTADRAGLLCCRDLATARQQIARQSVAQQRMHQDIDVDAALEGKAEKHPLWQRLAERLPELPLRLRALETFADSLYYRTVTADTHLHGATLSEIDAEIEEMLRLGLRS